MPSQPQIWRPIRVSRQSMPQRPRDNQRFWERVYEVMAKFPAAFPVTVTVLPRNKSGTWEVCTRYWDHDRFHIHVYHPGTPDENLNYEIMLDSFIHGYAHALDWGHIHDHYEPPYAAEHGPTWGVHYAKLYQSLPKK